jgi:hypothetical protein
MQFPLFDIEKISTNCDAKCLRILNKFQSLSTDSLKDLQYANEWYMKIPQAKIGFYKSIDQHRHALVDNTVNAEKFHSATQQFLKDITKLKMHQWHLEQHKILAEELIWQQFKVQCQSKFLNQLDTLKSFWQKQARFSYYTSQALIEIAEHIIPLFENYKHLLLVEFKAYQYRLPSSIRAEIKNYLVTLYKIINQEKNDLAEAMLSRLRVASIHRDVRFDDVTIHVAWELKKMGLLGEIHGLPQKYRRELTSSTFHYFHRFIYQNGNSTQNKYLMTFIWHKKDENHVILNEKNQFIVVPKNLLSSILYPSFLQRLFGKNQNKKFIIDHLPFITQLRFLPNPNSTFTSLGTFYENPLWHELCQLGKEIRDAHQAAQKQKPSGFWSQFFQSNKIKFITEWQVYLLEQQKNILNVMLAYAEYVAFQLKTRFGLKDISVISLKSFQTDIKEFHTMLLSCIDHIGVAKEDLQQYQAFLLLYNRVVNKSPSPPVEPAGEGEVINESHARPILNTLPSEPKDCTLVNIPISQLNDGLIKLQTLLFDLIPENSLLDLQHDSNHQEMIQTLLSFVVANDIKARDIMPEKQEVFEILFKSYLNIWIEIQEEDKEKVSQQLIELEAILDLLAPVFIQTRLSELIKIRNEACWFLFQAKCHSFIVSLEKINSEEVRVTHLAQLEKLVSSHQTKSTCLTSVSFLNQLKAENHNVSQQSDSLRDTPEKHKSLLIFR